MLDVSSRAAEVPAADEAVPGGASAGWPTALLGTARRSLPDLGVLLVVVLATYWSVLTGRYAFLDDYGVLYRARRDPGDLLAELIGAGRPVTGALDYVIFGLVPGLAELALVRALALLWLVCFAALVLLLLRTAGVPRLVALTAGVAIAALPSSGVTISWATTHHVPFALLLASCAALVVAPSPGRPWRPSAARCGAATGLLAAALCDYQPAAMVFWGVVAALLILPRTGPTRASAVLRAAVAPTLVFGAASAMGLGVLRFGVAASDVTSERANLVTDVGAKTAWYFTALLPRALAPEPLATHARTAAVAGLLLLLGLALLGARNGAGRLLTPVIGAGALLAASTPNLVTAENWASARSSSGLMSVVVLLGACALAGVIAALVALASRLPNHLPGSAHAPIVVPLAIGALTLSWAAVDAAELRGVIQGYMVEPQEEELALVMSAVESAAATGLPVTLVPGSWADTRAPGIFHDEFGTPSTCCPGNLTGMFQLVHREMTGDWFPRDIAVVDNPADGSGVAAPEGRVVIDFGHLLQPAQGPAVYTSVGPPTGL